LDSIFFLRRLVLRSATRMTEGDKTGVEPFLLDTLSSTLPSKLEISFAIADQRYTYGVLLTESRIVDEHLIAYPKGLPQHWFHRTYDETTMAYVWAKPSARFKADKDLQGRTRDNALFLSVAAQFNHPQLSAVFQWFKHNLQALDLGADRYMTPSFSAKLFKDNEAARSKALNLLKSADVGITGIQVMERVISAEKRRGMLTPTRLEALERAGGVTDLTQLDVGLVHQAAEPHGIQLDFENESTGTRRLFALLEPWLDNLKNGYTILIDELDSSLHPLLVRELLKMIMCDEHNPNGAQLLFTSHNAMLLDRTVLRRDQIWFTEKNDRGETNLYPLTDFQPRKDEALAKGYLAGRYGGIPYLPEGLAL